MLLNKHMFKFISTICYSSIIFCLLSGCYHIGNTSLHIKSNATSQLLSNSDRILITTNHPNFESDWIFKNVKIWTKAHFIERGYSIVEKNTLIKPNVIVVIEPDLKIQFFQGTQFVCEAQFIQMSNINGGDNNNTYTTCYNKNNNAYTFIYDYNLTIYRPDTIYSDTNQYIASTDHKQNIIFSSRVSYKTGRIENNAQTYEQIYANIDDKIYKKITDAIFATFPLNQNSLVYFQNTPDGYIPTQIIKK